jgi:hypothetical protein
MEKVAIHAIDATKPYKGGNDALWRLNRLNNIDKHRLLITAGGRYQSLNIGAFISGLMSKAMPHLPTAKIDVWFGVNDNLFPLKQGDELFADVPDAEPTEDMQFSFSVAFGEPGIIEGKPILPEIKQLADLVDNLILSFKPLL